VTPPSTLERYRAYLKYSRRAEQEHFFIIAEASGELAGVINIGAIVRGYFNSAPIGYYAFLPHAGKGLMRAGLGHAISYAFRRAKLHRLEANIQPGNLRSIALVRGLGFRNEGFSPKFLKISGKWRDHQRWALLVEEWRG
jgi:ribosomal-protein-alanine N-acetyltransferase